MMWQYGTNWGGFYMLLFWLIPLLLLALLIKYVFMRPPEHDISRTALEILKERYARGEIGRDEYLQKQDDLKR